MNLDEHIETTVMRAVENVLKPLLNRMDRLEQINHNKPDGKLLWTEGEAAKLLGIAQTTLKKWRVQGKVKSHTPLGARRPLYGWTEIETIAAQLADDSLQSAASALDSGAQYDG